MKKIIALIMATILAAAALAACAGSNSPAPQAAPRDMAVASSAAYGGEGGFGKIAGARLETQIQEDAVYDEAEMPADTGGGVAGPAVVPVVDSRKIIKNVSMQMQTLTFDSGVDAIQSAAESFGGYVQDSYIDGRDMYNERGNRTASFTLRIPTERLDELVNTLGGQFNVINKSQNSQDITDSYFDSKARLDSLKMQEERLLAMLQNAAELEYMLKVETELMNVRYQIESLTAALKRMDGQVSLSTVSITLYEVVKYEQIENVPITFGERLSRAFSQSWIAFSAFSQNFAVGLVEVLPFLLLIAVVVIVVVLIARSSKKRRDRRRQLNGRPAAHTPQNAGPAAAEPDASPAGTEKEPPQTK